jgi:hypothetical protein
LQLGFKLRLKRGNTSGYFATRDRVSRQFRTIIAHALESEKFTSQCDHCP